MRFFRLSLLLALCLPTPQILDILSLTAMVAWMSLPLLVVLTILAATLYLTNPHVLTE